MKRCKNACIWGKVQAGTGKYVARHGVNRDI